MHGRYKHIVLQEKMSEGDEDVVKQSKGGTDKGRKSFL